jgi:AraC-like DNA-binding protein
VLPALLAARALNIGWRRNGFCLRFTRVLLTRRTVLRCSAGPLALSRCGEMRTVLTTADVADRKRVQFWQDAVCDTFVELDCRARAERSFFGEITTAQCDGLHFSSVHAEGQIVKRTHTRIRRAREEVMLISLQVRGMGIISQDGREARLKPGDFACYDSTRPYTLNFDAEFEQLVLHMPREAMVRRIGRTEMWTARRIEGASLVGSLVLPFVQRTASIVAEVAPATASRLSETCLSLVTAALGERLGAIAEGGTSARTALIFRAKAIIESNLHDHALNTERVAEAVGISPRYLQDLFHAEGTTVSDWIWKRRLDKSRRDLADSLRACDSIAQIALTCGFADFGHFSRRYKEAFGASPREDRVRLRTGASDAFPLMRSHAR